MQPIIIEEKLLWSKFDPKPAHHYNEDVDEWITFWNGFILPHRAALAVCMSHYKIKGPTISREVDRHYEHMIRIGALGPHITWKRKYNPIVIYASNTLNPHIKELIETHKVTVTEALKWFDLNALE